MPNTRVSPSASGAPEAPPLGWVARVASVAVVAPVLFFAVIMVLGFVTPGYNWTARYASELSLGGLGWVMIANFILFGLVELGLATALWPTVADRMSGWVAAIAVGVFGAAFVVAGVCVTDPAKLVAGSHTWHGMVHALMAVVIFFIATPIAGLFTGFRFRHQIRLAAYCVVTAVATPALLVLTFVSGSLVGLTERIAIAVLLAWLTTVALQLRRGSIARSR